MSCSSSMAARWLWNCRSRGRGLRAMPNGHVGSLVHRVGVGLALGLMCSRSSSEPALAQVAPNWHKCGGYDARTHNWVALTTGALRTKSNLFGARSLSGGLVWFAGSEMQDGKGKSCQGDLAGLGVSLGWLIKGHLYLSASYGFGAFAGASPHGIPFGGLSLRF